MLKRFVITAVLMASGLSTRAMAQGSFEYVGKIVCGPQGDSSSMSVVRGFYATVINVRNPGTTAARIRKSVIWTLPPGLERPVPPRIADPGLSLPAGQGFAAECRDVLRRTDTPPNAFHEGLFIISSSVPLDVVGVYTAAPVSPGIAPFAGQVSSIHLDRFPLRQVPR